MTAVAPGRSAGGRFADLQQRLQRIKRRHLVHRLRLWSGLVLFAFLVLHLGNHALGLVSLEFMDRWRPAILAIWQTWPGLALLALAALIHVALALWGVYLRRRLRMPAWQWTQILLGIAIPPLLVSHVLGTRVSFELFDVLPNYPLVQWYYWSFAPWSGAKQVVVLLVAWVHAMVGLHFWLRSRPWYARAAPWLLALAVAYPVLALAGIAATAPDAVEAVRDPAALEALMSRSHFHDFIRQFVYSRERWLVLGFLGLVLLVLAARLCRALWERRRGAVRLSYPGGRTVVMPPGSTVLEASRMAGIPHASVCGGRGRCSTCRIYLGEGRETVGEPAEAECKVLQRIGAPPNVRLACQLRPSGRLEVVPLLDPASVGKGAKRPTGPSMAGEERDIAVMFCDIRGFTTFSESRLPYDVVFVLNRYFEAMGHAIEDAGGRLDKFIGDGIMALFGIEQGCEIGCRNALRAARAMAEQLDQLNDRLKHDLPEPLRIGIGIHAGPAIVGEMGYGEAVSLTAVGDTVNTASRLEGLTKSYAVQLVISETVAAEAGLDPSDFAQEEVEIRGRLQPLAIYVIEDARALG